MAVDPTSFGARGEGSDARVPFEVGGVVGRGGMGEVRAAHDPRLGRYVALKTVAPGDPVSAARLAREAVLTARLEHPGIMPVYQAGLATDGRPWYAMRLFTGRSLAEAIREARTPVDRLRLVRHVLDAAQAVAYAHGEGVIHRDLKPANVLTGAFGETIVADWGLACTADDEGRDVAAGTPGYMSPEQAAGRRIDGRTDVYGLGAVLAEVLSGAPPDPRAGFFTVAAPGIPSELVAIAERALRPDPDARYPTAAAFAADLLAWFEGRRVDAHGYTPTELAWRLLVAWRVPLGVAAVGLVGVGVAAALGLAATAEQRHKAELSQAETQSARLAEGRAFASAVRSQAWVASAQGFVMEAEVLAANALRRDESPEARGVLAAVYGRPRWTRLAVGDAPACAHRAISQDGQRALCIVENEARILDLGGSAPPTVAAGTWERGAFAGDGSHLLLMDDSSDVYSWTPPAAPVQVSTGVSRWGAFGRSPWPHQQALQGGLTEIRVDLAHNTAAASRSCGANIVQAVTLAADGAMLAACNDYRVMRTAPGGPSDTLATLDEADGLPALVSSLPDGRLFVGTVKGRAYLLGPAGEVLIRRQLGDGSLVTVEPRGDHLVVGLDSGDLAVWDAVADTVKMRFHARGAPVAWLDDTHLRLFGDSIEDRLAPPDPRPHRVALDAGISAVAWSPDGGLLAAAQGNGFTSIVDPRSGALLRRVAVGTGVAKDLGFSPDGRSLLVASAGLTQGIYAVSDGAPTATVAGFAARRSAWFAEAGPLLLPYAKNLWRRDAITGAFVEVSHPGLTDIETNESGTRAAAIGVDDALWLGVDGPTVRWHAVAPMRNSTGVAAAGTDLFVSTVREVIRYDAQDQVTWRAPIPDGAIELAASPDGRWVALGLKDGTVLAWAVGEQTIRARMLGHHGRVSALAFSPDSRWLASGAWDNDLRVWSVAAFEADAASTAAAVEAAWGTTLAQVLSP